MQKHCHCKSVLILYSTQTTKHKTLQRRTDLLSLYDELTRTSTLNCASLVHWLLVNVFHLVTVLLDSYIDTQKLGRDGWMDKDTMLD